MVSDDAGNPVSAFNYDAYGAVRQSAGEGRSFTFTGEQPDTETSMVFLRARYYDPQIGRFLSRDSIPPTPLDTHGVNRYSYTQDNPLLRTDPSGHFWVAALLAVGGALTAYDIGSSVYTNWFDPNATTQQRTEAAENLGTYVTANQIAGPMGEVGGACLGSARTVGKLFNVFKSLSRRAGPVGAEVEEASQVAQIVNRVGRAYPSYTDPRTSKAVPFPNGELQVVPEDQRVVWDNLTRGQFIKEWIDRGYPVPAEGWGEYDIHHIRPREHGGDNDFWNLVPIKRGTHRDEFNAFWRDYA